MTAARNLYTYLAQLLRGSLLLSLLLCSFAMGEEDNLANFAETFIRACERFKISEGRVPESEIDLVPKHLSAANSVIVHQGVRLKFIFVSKMRYKLNGMDILAMQSRPTRHEGILRSQRKIVEGRHIITEALQGYWVDEVQIEEIISCREEKADSMPIKDTQSGSPAPGSGNASATGREKMIDEASPSGNSGTSQRP